MMAAETQYCELEAELQDYLDNYERTHDYDEYHYDLDDIEHDPYVLISAITALHGGEWTIDEVGGTIQMLFEKQYILTETVEAETRYRTETRTGTTTYTDPDTGETVTEEYEYEVQVPYTYYICTVELENFNLSHVPVYIMSHDQLSMYATYMSTLGNRPDLFPSSSYVDAYYNTEYEVYEIPPEALADPQFAAMIEEAEKYLGYPYVWGGSSPSTSFDCSGFVSYVLNNCGVGWNVGRLGASGLLGICTRVSSANVQPGDLIFFEGTYDTTGASHVGIYVGNNMMIHCGDPIQYARIDTSYWQSHFLAFGRLPNPEGGKMNPKVIKLREEREKNSEKISSLQARNKKIDADIMAIENTDIIGMVREHGFSPDMLMELIKAAKGNPIPAPTGHFEETED